VFLSLGDLTHPLFALLEALTHWSIPNGGLLARHQFLGLALSTSTQSHPDSFLVGFDGLGSLR
jgi:hypothetical protein